MNDDKANIVADLIEAFVLTIMKDEQSGSTLYDHRMREAARAKLVTALIAPKGVIQEL